MRLDTRSDSERKLIWQSFKSTWETPNIAAMTFMDESHVLGAWKPTDEAWTWLKNDREIESYTWKQFREERCGTFVREYVNQAANFLKFYCPKHFPGMVEVKYLLKYPAMIYFTDYVFDKVILFVCPKLQQDEANDVDF